MQVPLTLEQSAAIEANRQAAIQRQQNKRPHSVLMPDSNPSVPSSSFGRPINLQQIQQQLIFDNEIRSSSSQEANRPQQSWRARMAEFALPSHVQTSSHGTGKKPYGPVSLQIISVDAFTCTAYQDMMPVFRNTPGATYGKSDNAWRIPLKEYQGFITKIPEHRKPKTSIPKNVLTLFTSDAIEQRNNAKKQVFDLSCLEKSLNESLFPFQVQGIQWALRNGGKCILADDMGLGKSLQALGIAMYYKQEWPMLIVTPASMVATWTEQVKRWIPELEEVVDVEAIFEGKNATFGGRAVNIVSFDLAVKLIAMIKDKKFKLIIADESHALRNRSTKRSKTLVPLFKKADRIILLSGTPALSRPVELFSQIECVCPGLFPNFTEYGMRYCNGRRTAYGWDWRGATNTNELQLILEHTCMLRRTKEQVLTQLPSKTRQQIFLKVPSKDLAIFASKTSQLPQSKERIVITFY